MNNRDCWDRSSIVAMPVSDSAIYAYTQKIARTRSNNMLASNFDLLVIVGIFLVRGGVWSQAQPKSQFKKVTVNSTDLCAADEPSSVLTFLPDQPVANHVCIPPTVLCARSCSRDSNCISYNYKEDFNRCELYDVMPISFSTVIGCVYFQVA